MKIYWDKRKSAEFQAVSEKDIAVIVVGSCEQHAKHLPTGTDNFLGWKIAEAAAGNSRKNVYLLPIVSYGFSAHHMDFPGTITLKQKTLVHLLEDIAESVLKTGIRNLVFLISHGGNSAAVQTAVNDLGERNDSGCFVMLRYWDFMREFMEKIRDTELGGIGHAGEMETSLMKAVCPDLVGKDTEGYQLARGNEWNHPDMFAANKVTVYKNFKEISPWGNVGVPDTASKEKGEKILNYVTKEIARFFDEYF